MREIDLLNHLADRGGHQADYDLDGLLHGTFTPDETRAAVDRGLLTHSSDQWADVGVYTLTKLGWYYIGRTPPDPLWRRVWRRLVKALPSS